MADYQNISSFTLQQLSELLSSFGVPGDAISKLIMPLLISPGSKANQFIWPGAGASGGQAAVSYVNDIMMGSYSNSMKQIQDMQQRQALTAMMRAVNPGQTAEQYAGAVSDQMRNPFSATSMIYNMVDPYGMRAGGAAAQQLAASLYRSRGGFGMESAPLFGQINRALFGDQNIYETEYDTSGRAIGQRLKSPDLRSRMGIMKDVLDNPREYGNLSVSDVMTLGRELALTNPTGYTSGSGATAKFKAEEFQRDLKELSSAIQPWKDILGKDMPELLKQLEGLTGQNISGNIKNISSSGYRMASLLGQTGATAQTLAAYTDALMPALTDPTGRNRSILGAMSIAGDIISGTAGGSHPMLTQREYQVTTAEFFGGTARSAYAERFSQAFAAFSDKEDQKGRTNEERMATFTKLMSSAVDSGLSANSALVSVSGAPYANFEGYRGSEAYMYSMKQGAGASAARDAIVRQMTSKAYEYYASSEGYNGNAAVANYIKGLDTKGISEFYALSWDSMREVVAKQMGVDPKSAEAFMELRKVRDAAVSGFDAATGGSKQFEQYQTYVTSKMTVEGRQQSIQEEAAFRQRADSLMSVGGIRGVLDKLSQDQAKGGPGVQVSDLLMSYTGGNKVMSALLQGAANKKFTPEQISDASNFMLKNWGTIADTEGPLYSIYTDVISSDETTRTGAINRLISLEALGSGWNKLDQTQRQSLVTRLGKGTWSETAVKDAYRDALASKMIEESPGLTRTQRSSMLDFLKNTTVTTEDELKSALTKNMPESGMRDKMLGVVQKAYGDIDGTDGMFKLIGLLDGVMKKLEEWCNAGAIPVDVKGGK